ncbi:MAG: DNA-directed RNA polymerase subunit delta [Solobacterium sp.]|nr:DNA-directed RNA polymerase subunit delta [Solobacterium sp.]MBQ9823539.1 DNA-directed RNA polymerase subunit delta [Solobacterium sp.]
MRISLTDAAYDYLKTVNSCVPFNELYSKAAEKAEIPEDQLKRKRSSFYSHLSLDSRFTQRENNTWDLTENHSYDETHITVEEMDTDDDEEETEDTELTEGEDGESAENLDGSQTEEY